MRFYRIVAVGAHFSSAAGWSDGPHILPGMSKLTPKLTYANVAATLALVFSMSGGALAASHYLINSKSQINPKVVRALKGHQRREGGGRSSRPRRSNRGGGCHRADGWGR